MEIWTEYIVQLGGIGMMLAGLIYISRYLLMYNLSQLKTKEEENKVLEKEFREHLMSNEKLLIEVVRKNSDAFELLAAANNRLSDSIDKSSKTCVMNQQ